MKDLMREVEEVVEEEGEVAVWNKGNDGADDSNDQRRPVSSRRLPFGTSLGGGSTGDTGAAGVNQRCRKRMSVLIDAVLDGEDGKGRWMMELA